MKLEPTTTDNVILRKLYEMNAEERSDRPFANEPVHIFNYYLIKRDDKSIGYFESFYDALLDKTLIAWHYVKPEFRSGNGEMYWELDKLFQTVTDGRIHEGALDTRWTRSSEKLIELGYDITNEIESPSIKGATVFLQRKDDA